MMAKMTVSCDVEISGKQMATLFADMFAHEQAEFFEALAVITRSWTAGLWGVQAAHIADRLGTPGKDIIRALALEIDPEDT